VEQAVAHAAAAVVEDETGRYEAALEQYLAAASSCTPASVAPPALDTSVLFVGMCAEFTGIGTRMAPDEKNHSDNKSHKTTKKKKELQ
jgi:hypothetical protein